MDEYYNKWNNIPMIKSSIHITPEAHNLIHTLQNIIDQIKTNPAIVEIYQFEISVMLDTMKQDDRFKDYNLPDPRIQT